MIPAVLDASALLAMLLSEPGAERVRAELPGAVMTTVNLGEVVGHYARNGVGETDIHAVLDPLPIEGSPSMMSLPTGPGSCFRRRNRSGSLSATARAWLWRDAAAHECSPAIGLGAASPISAVRKSS
ncbi:MAG: hypothetical protein J5I81_13035 [Nitrococcus mobilis]|nr:hypothetical protein [Nitrococcus mobilis]